ncbi:MAG: hypothetical protein ABIL11_04765 [Chloroflexota bacterium]
MSKKRNRKCRKDHLEALRQELQSDEFFARKEVIFKTDVEEKMSEVLLAFIEPYREFATNREAYERLIVTAIVAWNAAVVPKKEREKLLDETSKSIMGSAGDKAAQDFKSVVNELMEWKKRHFPANKRYIVSYQLSETKHKYHLAVASTLER